MVWRRFYVLFVTTLLPISLLGGCFIRDTCTQGDNMTNPRVAGGFDADASSPKLVIVWDIGTERGAALPDAYFEEARFAYTGQDMPPLSEVAYTAIRELTVTFGNLSAYLSSHNSVFFSLAFPDRVEFIDCTHPASPDRYLLNVTMSFTPKGEFIGAEFEQVTNRGGF